MWTKAREATLRRTLLPHRRRRSSGASITSDDSYPLSQITRCRRLASHRPHAEHAEQDRGLQWHDIDRKALSVSIERQVISTRDGIIIDSPKTEAGSRTLAITRSTLNVLIRHRKRQMEMWGVTAKEMPAWLFTKPDGTMLDPGYF